MIRLSRIYDREDTGNARKILVDRLWPRGVPKAAVDTWMKEIAPSEALRKWFDHDPQRWDEFRRRYFEELAASDEPKKLLEWLRSGNEVVLLYAARDRERNNAVALSEYLISIPP